MPFVSAPLETSTADRASCVAASCEIFRRVRPPARVRTDGRYRGSASSQTLRRCHSRCRAGSRSALLARARGRDPPCERMRKAFQTGFPVLFVCRVLDVVLILASVQLGDVHECRRSSRSERPVSAADRRLRRRREWREDSCAVQSSCTLLRRRSCGGSWEN